MSSAGRGRTLAAPWLGSAVTVLILLGCSGDASGRADTEPAALSDVTWTLEMLGTDTALEDTDVTLTFAGDSMFAGSAGCNRYFGQLSLSTDSVRFGDAGSTMMMCSSPHMEQEGRYLGALRRVTSYQMIDERLVLFEGSIPALTFGRGEPSDNESSSPQ